MPKSIHHRPVLKHKPVDVATAAKDEQLSPEVLAAPVDHAHVGWQGTLTKMMVGVSLFSALLVPGAQMQQTPTDSSLLTGRTAQMRVMTQKPEVKLPAGTTFRLVAPGPQVTVTANDALSYIVAAWRAQDGSKLSFADVRALNPKIFARDVTGGSLRPGDVVTLPFGAIKVSEPRKLVPQVHTDGVDKPSPVVTLPVDEPAIDKPVVVAPVVVDKPVVVAPVVVDKPVVVAPVVVDKPVVVAPVEVKVPDHAAFKFPALQVGKQLPADGVFKTKQFFKTWTINFTGSAKVVASDAGKLVLHVKATGTNGIFEGKSRTVALEWHQEGATSGVRFSGKELGDNSDDDVGAKLELISSSATESVFRGKDGPVRLSIAGGTMTLTYGDNTIRFKVGP